MKKRLLLLAWLMGIALSQISVGHALNYIGRPQTYFLFDTLIPLLIILGLVISSIHHLGPKPHADREKRR